MIDILIPAFVISLVLLGIHSYFGIRIIERGIIFTDLAIGQMAAFGAAFSILLFHGKYLYIISLCFAILTGFLISFASKWEKHLEAIIGLLYALGLSGVFILLSRSPHGMEKLAELMAYDILFTEMTEVYKTAIIYAAIGGLIYVVNRWARGNLKEIFFFLAFAATVTSSVKMAGVLVVFAILLAPALLAIRLKSWNRVPDFFKKYPVILAWIIGTIINIIAILTSDFFDLPTGYTLTFMNAFFAIAFSFVHKEKNIKIR